MNFSRGMEKGSLPGDVEAARGRLVNRIESYVRWGQTIVYDDVWNAYFLLYFIENGFDGFGVGEIGLNGEVGGFGELFFGCSGDHDGLVRVGGEDPREVETDVRSSAEDEDDF
jgi:hypothetical protein